jgi:hypothetical protein
MACEAMNAVEERTTSARKRTWELRQAIRSAGRELFALQRAFRSQAKGYAWRASEHPWTSSEYARHCSGSGISSSELGETALR